ncbi:MAG: AAA family ATPase [Patescibacteria group bacterium]
MYLKGLEISGFKSFAKKTVLQFSTPITAVVGPNGSGKSNTAEAFRFVLGEQSIKSMRGKRTEDLIWNGGGDTARANRASVKVVFDNHQRMLNVDFDEVSLERVIYRDSSSEYFINGTQVRLKDIIELLAGAHIGSSGHHIISQGEADKILNANSKERRDMLEDALGLKIYQYKRLESERKLEKTDENMKSVESLRKEIAPHLKFLKKQVEKVEKTLELKEELRTVSKNYFKREEVYITFQRQAIESDRKKPTDDLAQLQSDLAKAKAVLEISAGVNAKNNETIKLESDLSAVRNEKDRLARELGRIEGAIGSEERIVRREKEMMAQEGNQQVLLKDVEAVRTTIEQKIVEVEKFKDENSLQNFFDFIRATFDEFIKRHKRGDTTQLLNQSLSEIERLKSERQTCEAALADSNKKEEDLRATLLHMQKLIEKDKDSTRDAEREMFRIMNEENLVRNILASLKAREERLNLLDESFKRDVQEVMMLVGREVYNYTSEVILAENGAAISAAEIAAEERVHQEERRRSMEKMKIRIEDAGTGGGEDVLKEYNETLERDQFLERELADLAQSALSLKNIIVELEEKLDTEFREGVLKINTQFQNFFNLMFGGGSASLQVVRETKKKKSDTDLEIDMDAVPTEDGEEDMEEKEGIEIDVSLPRKKIKGLMMLSGGERALTSIALLFAISQVNPPPFVILDETDAALDEANSKKYGDMIENLSKLSQLILITHNRETMSRAGVLYGVTMGSGGVSKLLSIAFEEAVAVAK